MGQTIKTFGSDTFKGQVASLSAQLAQSLDVSVSTTFAKFAQQFAAQQASLLKVLGQSLALL